MKIISIGRGTVFELWQDNKFENVYFRLSNDHWDEIELWCRDAKIGYKRSGNTLSFFKDIDVTTFMLRWG